MTIYLKKLATRFEDFFLKFYQSIFSLVRIFANFFESSYLPTAQTDTCYIIGNGPSFKNTYINHQDLLKKSHLLCVNTFPTSIEYQVLKPQTCIFLDPIFFSNDLDEMLPSIKETLNCLRAKTTWKIQLLIPTKAKNSNAIQEVISANKNIDVYYFNYTIVQGFDFFQHYFYKINKGMPQCQNVLTAAIFLALNLKFKSIYLLGADHTWMQNLIVKDDNNLYFKQTYFYEDQESSINYSKLTPFLGKEKMDMTDFCILCKMIFSSYQVLQKYSFAIGSNIYNATEGSYIDAFERKVLSNTSNIPKI